MFRGKVLQVYALKGFFCIRDFLPNFIVLAFVSVSFTNLLSCSYNCASLLACFVKVISSLDLQATVTQNLLAKFFIRTLKAHDEGHIDSFFGKVFCTLNNSLSDDVMIPPKMLTKMHFTLGS